MRNRLYSSCVKTPFSASSSAAPDAVEILADPEQRLQVAQAALAVLDVGLDEIAAFADLAVTLVAFGELGLGVFGAGVLHHFEVEAADQLLVERFVAPQETGLEDRGADRVVGARQAYALVDVAGGVTDLQAEVPQHVEHVFDDLLARRRLLVGQHEQKIDVGARRQRAAAVAADRDDHHPFGRRRVVRPVHMGGGEIVEGADDLVHQMRKPRRAGGAAAILHQHALGASHGRRRAAPSISGRRRPGPSCSRRRPSALPSAPTGRGATRQRR